MRYVATLRNVREVFVRGVADIGYWTRKLIGEQLSPATCYPDAMVLISGVKSTFLGVRFTEISISVAAQPLGGRKHTPGLYLACVYTRSRLIACFERKVSRTPYYAATVEVMPDLPASMRLSTKEGEVFCLAMGDAQAAERVRQAVLEEPEGWEGEMYLPRAISADRRTSNMFFAKVTGAARLYSFLPARDKVWFRNSQGVLLALADSGFKPTVWGIRTGGTHAKSGTIERVRQGI